MLGVAFGFYNNPIIWLRWRYYVKKMGNIVLTLVCLLLK